MGKNKRQKLGSTAPKKQKGSSSKGERPGGISKGPGNKARQPKKHVQAQHTTPTIPFSPSDQILLIGEGDLSFARSLVESHKCTNVTATVFEPEQELLTKYPHVGENIKCVEQGGGIVRYGVDATKMSPWTDKKGRGGVGYMDRIFFNFPHVGGKSTDVNRQVRYNQELLVSFFKNATPSLSQKPGSSIIVTLFEGEPYTLWNIRDLARHSGLQVQRSFKFQAQSYPGYKHARTLGVVKGRNGEEGGGWKGEERAARSFVLWRKGEDVGPGQMKRKRNDSSGDEDTEDEENDHDR